MRCVWLLGKCLYHFALTLLRAPADGHEAEYKSRAHAHLSRARDVFHRLGMAGDEARATKALGELATAGRP